jgi:hypothetical protein
LQQKKVDVHHPGFKSRWNEKKIMMMSPYAHCGGFKCCNTRKKTRMTNVILAFKKTRKY